MSVGELERMTRRYTAGIINTLGPDSDVPAPDVNTNERVMAWIMDTYSMHVGHTVTAVVTGKPVEMGGSLGRREATGRGCMIVTKEALDASRHRRSQGATVAVQGFGNVGSVAARAAAQRGLQDRRRSATARVASTTRTASTSTTAIAHVQKHKIARRYARRRRDHAARSC